MVARRVDAIVALAPLAGAVGRHFMAFVIRGGRLARGRWRRWRRRVDAVLQAEVRKALRVVSKEEADGHPALDRPAESGDSQRGAKRFSGHVQRPIKMRIIVVVVSNKMVAEQIDRVIWDCGVQAVHGGGRS